MHRLLLCVLLVACAEAGSQDLDLEPSGLVSKADGFCPGVPAGIAPWTFPTYSCGPLDLVNGAIAADVNRFWGSNVTACACGPDFPQGCFGAWSLTGTGYVWIGLDFVNRLTGAAGSLMPAQYVMAHEFGHEIQGRYGALAPTTQQNELGADCLAGYYLGSLACRGNITLTDVIATLTTACITADGTGNPIADLATHGTCEQRMHAVRIGIEAYLGGQRPLDVCAL